MKTYFEERPWGSFERFVNNQECTVKFLNIKKGGVLSLQSHKQRKEFWRVVSGNPRVIIGKTDVIAKPGESFFVKTGQIHRLAAPKNNVTILEIAFGHFKEGDIKRYEDKYNRNK
ncbi:phosphomannose isomerase type II C-terminal cupin domain [Candidatus Nomurabacteria bacterium]|nr:phosphomannose isomerase type II C-terminal cupin domain [Candidatus Nomurabacteria bacterium]MCB9820343.1 phosphomannose isomerase type II C-terminal cupin domain [Candidatus Nomurabacteria bacterium]